MAESHRAKIKPITSGGGWRAIAYSLRIARRVGGFRKFYRALASRNACKTCALGMGGQAGGMRDEAGRWPEVCKKSMQAMAADMQGRITGEFWRKYSIDEMRAMSPRDLEHMGRLAEPVYAGPADTHFRPIGWDEAMRLCGERFAATQPDENFFYTSGRSSNEAGFLLHLFARLYGTNNVNNCSYYCHQASGVGLGSALGTGTATIQLEDLKQCDTVFLIGGNPASNHPRLMRLLMDLRRRGGKVVVINPMVETGLVNFSVPSDWKSLLRGSEIATHYVQPHIGGDIAFLAGVAKRLHERGAFDRAFIEQYTEGYEAFQSQISDLTFVELSMRSGIGEFQMREIASVYAKSKATIFAWTMGITHHVHGVDNVREIVNLALLRGMVGKPGAGLLPIRGHSNVQGMGSVGVTPALKDAVFKRLESHFGVKLPTTPGMDTLACMEAMHAGRIRNAWCLGGNLFGSNPDAKWTTQAFSKLESVVYLSTTLNTGHAWGRGQHTLILPVKARDEESEPTTQESMFSFVRMSDGGAARLEGPRGEVEIIAEWGERALAGKTPVDWSAFKTHRNIREAIAATIPGYEEVGKIDETKKEFHIPGRTYHKPTFNTPSGKAKFHAVPIPNIAVSPRTLQLMTIRSEGQFNTVVYEDDDLYRGQDRRNVILMNADDIAEMGLQVDQPGTVRSETGAMSGILVRAFPIRAGNAAMYCPEANVLVPRHADPESRTPAFKSVQITLTPDTSSHLVQLRTPERAIGRDPVGQRLKSC